MDIKIITISREFGSGGRTIGREVANRLNIPFYDKELVEQVALESGFAPKFVEEHGEHSPTASRLAYAFSNPGVPGIHRGFSMDRPMRCYPAAGRAGALCHRRPQRRLYS